jgi:hypothetical protein
MTKCRPENSSHAKDNQLNLPCRMEAA